jgi:glyoxylase-like metal-dependent hydrolase (beta-lactamase superfamily II)
MSSLARTLDPLAAALAQDASRRLLLRRLAGGVAGGLAALTVVGVAPGRAAQEATPAAPPAAAATGAVHRFVVGSFELVALSDGALNFPNPAFGVPVTQVLFVDAPPAELDAALREAGLAELADAPETAPASLAVTPLLVDTGSELVLIDSGIGGAGGSPDLGQLPASLAAAGVAPEDVDLVVLSHLHSDHVFGLVGADGAPVFANARYAMGRTEHAFWSDEARVAEVFPDPAIREQVLGPAQAAFSVIGDNLTLIDEAAEAEVVPGVRAVAAFGHTPGHTAFLIESDGERLLAVFDAFTHPLHLAHPDWNMAFDTFQEQDSTTRRGLMDRAAADDLLVHVYHFPFPGLGRVARDGAAWAWTPEA